MERKILDEIGRRMERAGLDEWEITDNLSVTKTAAGTFQVFVDGGMIPMDQITPEQEAAIKKEFGKAGGSPVDENPLIPGYSTPAKKGDPDPDGGNPLIP